MIRKNCNDSCRCSVREYREEYCRILDEMICSMKNVRMTNSISVNFIRLMTPHHMAAIRMSENILRCTENEQIRQIACSIIEEQKKSIENMRRIECECSRCTNTRREICMWQRQMNCIMETMFSEMCDTRATNNLSCNFLREMIPHHMGAVAMSEETLKYCICPELKPILDSIISSQRRGIRQMKELLRCLCC